MEYIKNIEIKNFKSIHHQTIEGCKRINVFIGYPNVGKSNILEVIGLFSSLQLRNENFRFNDICRVKHFSELFFNKDYKEIVEITLNKSLSLKLDIGVANNLNIRVQSHIDRSGNQDRHTIFSALIDNTQFAYREERDINENEYNYLVAPIKKYTFLNNNIIHLQRPLSLALPFGSNLLDVLQRNSDLRREVASIFKEYGLNLFIDGEEIKFLKYLNDGTGVSIPYHQVAETLRILIFYKAAVLSNKETVLLFEEPEAHMFPPFIKKFTSEVIFDKASNQFFIATHSPYVLDAFMEDAQDDLSIYLIYFENGETKIKLMEQNDMDEVRKYGVDVFFNLESYLKHGQINND